MQRSSNRLFPANRIIGELGSRTHGLGIVITYDTHDTIYAVAANTSTYGSMLPLAATRRSCMSISRRRFKEMRFKVYCSSALSVKREATLNSKPFNRLLLNT